MLSSCGEKTFYEIEFVDNDEFWSYNEIKTCQFSISDTTKKYDLILDVEHSADFGFQNMYFKIKTTFPDGKHIAQQLPINLADNRGKWYGKCNAATCELRVVLQHQIYFKSIGDYSIEMEQYSRERNLEGIKKISFKII